VNGRSEVGFDDMVILDLYYIQNPSILTDLGIILRTIPVMLFGRGGG
jgi:lipopolysaccharide/colanic/teichoic acid biosynthesis glycosyltransferase